MPFQPDLWKEVREQFLPFFEAGRFNTSHRSKESGHQYVDLDDGDLIIRVMLERGTYQVRFLSMTAPADWFSLAEVMTYLGLVPQPLMPPSSIGETLADLRQLVRVHGGVLRNLFSAETYLRTRSDLLEIRAANPLL